MRSVTRSSALTLSLLLTLLFAAQPGHAESKWSMDADWDHKEKRYQERGRDKDKRRVIIIRQPQWRQPSSPRYREHPTIIVPRDRNVWGTRVRRPYGKPYHGYGYYFTDRDAFKWLAFTAITIKLLDNLNEEQQRLHEAAQVRATTANRGEVIMWEDGNAYGSVTTTRIGSSSAGRPCREFQHNVTIGGKTEQAWGIACMNPDGSWEVVP